MAIYFLKSKIIYNEIFSFIIILFLQFINIKGHNYSEIIEANSEFINGLTYGNDLRFCKECICVSYKVPKNHPNIIICLVKKNLYLLKQKEEL